MIIKDMDKLDSPFVRKMVDGKFVVTDEIDPEYKWVFEDDTVKAIEKLHGTNVSIIIMNGKITRIFNRTGEVPFFGRSKRHIVEGIMNSFERGYCNFTDGQYFGELIGPKLHSNPYKLEQHLWIPFSTYAADKLYYKSWGKYPKTFEAMSEWFKDLMPLFSLSKGIKGGFVEGIVFTHHDGRMSKLRRDMFDWYSGDGHKSSPAPKHLSTQAPEAGEGGAQ